MLGERLLRTRVPSRLEPTSPCFGRLLVLAVPLGAVFPHGHGDTYLAHVLFLLGGNVLDDGVVVLHAHTALLGDALAKPARHGHDGPGDARDGSLQRFLVPTDVAHQGGVVRGHLGSRAHIPARLVEVEIAQTEAAEIPEHLKGDAESFAL